MTASFSLQIALLAAMAGLVILAGLSDLRTWLVPNRHSFALAALFPVYVLAGGAEFESGLMAGALVFAAGLVFFMRGWMGGGDVKLLTALGLWAGTEQLLPMLMVVSLAGGVMCLVEWLGGGGPQRLAGRFVPALAGHGDAAAMPAVVPYAVAILVGGVYVAASEFLTILAAMETVR